MAAVEADRVVVALIGDTKGLDGPVNASATQFDRNMTKIEASATRAERQIVRSSGAIANAQRNMGRQIADIGTQLGGGASPFIILAQQLPQVADAAADMGGKMGRVASFLTSPWGAAALAATTVLVPLVAGLFKTGNEVDALVEKMRKQARQADQNRAAHNAWRVTIEGVTEAIRKRREEQEKSLKTDQQAEQQALANARGELATQRDNLTAARRQLADAEKQLENQRARATRGGDRSDVAALGVGRAEDRVARLRTRVSEIERTVRTAEQSVRGAEIPISERRVEGRIDAVAAATNRYTEALGRLRDERQRGIITQQQFERQLETERRRRDAAVKAAQDARAGRAPDVDSVPFVRPVQGGTSTGNFGERRGARGHGGIDIAVPVGTNVSAAAAGTIIESGTLPGYGNVVIIDHGRGTTTRYAHLSKLLAGKGDSVGAGDVIGLSGGARGAPGAGNSRGPHLHYEVRRNGRPVDPNGGVFPIDPATARQVRDKVQDDFDKLFDDLQRDAQQATDKITSDFESLERAMDPAVTISRELDETIAKIERARLIGIVDNTRALELQMKATAKASADLLGNVIGIDQLRDAAGLEKQQLDEREGKARDDEDKLQQRREDNIYQLADLYESLFVGGTQNLWEEFKRQGLRALALLAAQATFRLISGQSVGFGGGGEGDLLKLAAAAFSGRASGGYVAPGQTVRVNEHRGDVELFRPQGGGHIIPLGQTRAALPRAGGSRIFNISVSADNSVTPAGFARDLAGRILAEAQRMDAQSARSTINAVPGRMAQYGNDGT